jgi:uncharacterized coiled-coil DUF342 family protein
MTKRDDVVRKVVGEMQERLDEMQDPIAGAAYWRNNPMLAEWISRLTQSLEAPGDEECGSVWIVFDNYNSSVHPSEGAAERYKEKHHPANCLIRSQRFPIEGAPSAPPTAPAEVWVRAESFGGIYEDCPPVGNWKCVQVQSTDGQSLAVYDKEVPFSAGPYRLILHGVPQDCGECRMCDDGPCEPIRVIECLEAARESMDFLKQRAETAEADRGKLASVMDAIEEAIVPLLDGGMETGGTLSRVRLMVTIAQGVQADLARVRGERDEAVSEADEAQKSMVLAETANAPLASELEQMTADLAEMKIVLGDVRQRAQTDASRAAHEIRRCTDWESRFTKAEADLARVRGELAAECDARDKAEAANESDRTTIAGALGNARRVIASYAWASEGRGPYYYDDDEYQREFGRCLDEINNAIAPLVAVAKDFSDCPDTQAGVVRARASQKETGAPQECGECEETMKEMRERVDAAHASLDDAWEQRDQLKADLARVRAERGTLSIQWGNAMAERDALQKRVAQQDEQIQTLHRSASTETQKRIDAEHMSAVRHRNFEEYFQRWQKVRGENVALKKRVDELEVVVSENCGDCERWKTGGNFESQGDCAKDVCCVYWADDTSPPQKPDTPASDEPHPGKQDAPVEKINVTFIVNWEYVSIDVAMTETIRAARNRALDASQSTARPHDDWEVRTVDTGAPLDPAMTMAAFGVCDGDKLIVSLILWPADSHLPTAQSGR